MATGPRRLETGARTYLRAPGLRDERAFLAAVRASKALHDRWVFAPASAESYRAYVARMRRPDAKAFLVCRRTDDAIAGVINVSQIFMGPFRSGYLGYYAFEPHAGGGYMTEGMRLVLRHAFRTMGLHRLEANVQPDNPRSTALVKRCGFRLEGFSPRYLKVAGRWRDHERWAITAEETR